MVSHYTVYYAGNVIYFLGFPVLTKSLLILYSWLIIMPAIVINIVDFDPSISRLFEKDFSQSWAIDMSGKKVDDVAAKLHGFNLSFFRRFWSLQRFLYPAFLTLPTGLSVILFILAFSGNLFKVKYLYTLY